MRLIAHATLEADGVTLKLDRKIELPPGRVLLLVEPAPASVVDLLQRIDEERRRRGHVPMTEEQMAAELAKSEREDEEYEEKWRQIWAQTSTQSQHAKSGQ